MIYLLQALAMGTGIAGLILLAGCDHAEARRAAVPQPPVPLVGFLEGAPPETVAYRAGGPAWTFTLFKPVDWAASDRRTAVVFIHGGGFTAGDDRVFHPQARYLAGRGAVAFSINYRLETPAASPVPVSIADSLADCRSAMRHIRGQAARYGIDPGRVVAFGDSAGGHLAAALALCDGFDRPDDDLAVSARPDALILCNPVLDLTDDTWIRHIIRDPPPPRGTKPPPPDPTPEQVELARRLSPGLQVRPGLPPTLLMHGTADRVVESVQSQRFAEAARAAGAHCELEILEGIRHAFILTRYTSPEPVVVAAIRRTDRFLGSLGWLDGPPTLTVSDPPAWAPKR